MSYDICFKNHVVDVIWHRFQESCGRCHKNHVVDVIWWLNHTIPRIDYKWIIIRLQVNRMLQVNDAITVTYLVTRLIRSHSLSLSDIPSDTTHSITLSLQMNDTISRIIRLQVNRMIHLNRTISNLKTLRFDSKLRFESSDSIFDSKLCNSKKLCNSLESFTGGKVHHIISKQRSTCVLFFWYPHYDDTCWGENKCRVKIQSVSHGKK